MSDPTCPACDRPVKDQAVLCWPCTRRLERELGDVPALAGEIQTTRLRQARTSLGGGGAKGRDYDQLPNARPDKALDGLRDALLTWVARIGEVTGASWPRRTVLDHARYVHLHLEQMRRQDWSGDCYADLVTAVARLRHTIDRQPERVWIGPCATPVAGVTCQEDVYASRGATRATCRLCKATHEVKDRQAWLLAAAEDQLAPASLLGHALSRLGEPIPSSTIRSWVARARLVPHGLDLDGRPMYRVGDALDLLAAETARKARDETAREHDKLSAAHGQRLA